MSDRTKTVLIVLMLVAVVAVSFGAGWFIGTKTPAEPGLDVVEQAWHLIFRDYVDRDQLDAEALARGAIKGMLEVLGDPYSAYLDAAAYELSQKSSEGKFEGIGARVAAEDDRVVIIAPIADSPADRAGIRAGDVILGVDGRSTADMSLAEVVLAVQGPKGTSVTISVLHQGETEPEELTIVRAEIEVPSVNFEMMEDIAYIRITHFSERTAGELLPVLESIAQQAATGIILDLRQNPGGLLETVVDVAGFFLSEGVVIDVVDSEGNRVSYSVMPGEPTTDLPLVVLVDGYSASGSEVLAGALQDYERATVAGARTFGKGSVNILHELKDGSGLYISSARWLTPEGRQIEGEGLAPDYELELEGDDAVQWAIDFLKG